MKLLLLGSTGRVGSGVLEKALNDGHKVHVLARHPEKLAVYHENLTIHTGDATVNADLEKALEGCKSVISALGTDGGTVLTDSIPIVIQAMMDRGIKRLITVGTAGILESRTEPGLLRYQSNESRRRLTRAAEEHHRTYLAMKQSPLQWTVVCPTYLPDGPETGNYRVEKDYLPMEGTQISTGDTADFVYKQLSSNDFSQSRVGIAY